MSGMPYNQAAFNSGSAAGIDHVVYGSSSILFGGAATVGNRYTITGAANISFSGTADPARMQISQGETQISIGGLISPERIVFGRGKGDVVLTGMAAPYLDYKIAGDSGLIFDGEARIYADYAVSGSGSVDFSGLAIPIREIFADAFAGVAFGGKLGLGIYSEDSADINVALAPGQTLVIDTAARTVTLDDQNIISRYHGAWPWARPGNEEMIIEADGAIETQIVITERWL